ncbi:unnamed protein product [Paramecium octaurelia]|uniref:Uncharacterized protein n=1 Tax=Paramecium octaurelia TaxID=43137 RepID=A0A8S1YJI7_PAROT|nr:unnamed protein product [Paramecium octaurelia]
MSNQTNLIRDLIEKLTQQHKDYKLFKQLIKRQSKALESYNNEMIQISRQFNSDLFNGIHYHMSHFQSDLQNQYALLKELGKHFYEIKQEAQYYSKNYTKFESKLNSTSNAFDENSLKLKQTLQETTNFWAQKQEYSVIRINDMSNKGEEIIKKTNSLIYKFSEKHLFFIDNYKTCSGRKSRNSSCNRTSSSMQSALKSKETTNIYQDKSIDQTNCFQVGQSIQDFESDFNTLSIIEKEQSQLEERRNLKRWT